MKNTKLKLSGSVSEIKPVLQTLREGWLSQTTKLNAVLRTVLGGDIDCAIASLV